LNNQKKKRFDWVTLFIVIGICIFFTSLFFPGDAIKQIQSMPYSELMQKIEISVGCPFKT
jgi:hypothetical protein